MKKTLTVIFLFVISFILIISLIVGIFIKNISDKTNRSLSYFFQTYSTAQKNRQNIADDSISIMVFGLDRRDDLLEKTEVTDTIILANINLKTAKLNLISIPRDLWSYDTNTKVNSIYPLSKDKQNKFQFIQSEFEKITGQKITNTIVISTDNLIDFVQLIGGVDIYLENGFIDDKYPNPDYVANPSPLIPIYKTIKFPAGKNHLDISNITEFVRSRKNAETSANGGTDIGRILRQQLLIEAIIQKIKNSDFIKSPKNLIHLYNFWRQTIETNINDSDIITWGLLLDKNVKNITIQKTTVPTAEYPEVSVIYHPYRFINTQWVYIPEDENYKKLHQFIAKSIGE
ncbi:MAG: LCP family protein [Candidatus Shapirobacteria bacterium]|jgi:LCP family protein required for cell wall assembly